MSALASLDDRVGTLRVRADASDPSIGTVCRSMVRSASMPRRGRQVLVVRSLAVDTLAGDVRRIHRELASAVDAAWRRAQPPSRADRSDAVVFRDRAELVAHFVSDIAALRVSQRWWWAVLGDDLAPVGAGVAQALAAHPHDVPGVIIELDRMGRLDRVVALLDEPGAMRVLDAVAVAFALPYRSERDAAVDGGSDARTDARAFGGPASRPSASPQRKLVHLARVLATDPAAARSLGVFGPSDGDDLSVGHDPDGAAPVVRLDRRSSAPDASSARDDAAATDGPAGPVERRRTGSRSPDAASRHDHLASRFVAEADRPVDQLAAGEPAPGDEVLSLGTDTVSIGIPPADASPDSTRTERAPDGRERDDDIDEPLPHATAVPTDLATEWGGVFLLIAPMLELRVGEAFGERFESTVGWWGSLELLARSLVPLGPDVDRDPVWEVLASLNGDRSAIDRVRALRSLDLRLPADWSGAPAAVELPPVAATVASSLGGAALDWIERVRDRFVGHVCERLDVEPDAIFEVVRRRAAIASDRTHVEVVFPLDAAHLAVRRAGFDRDPGWVPELGRVVLFHFGGHRPLGEASP